MHYISEGCLEIKGYTFESFKDVSVNYSQLVVKKDRNMVWAMKQNSIK